MWGLGFGHRTKEQSVALVVRENIPGIYDIPGTYVAYIRTKFVPVLYLV